MKQQTMEQKPLQLEHPFYVYNAKIIKVYDGDTCTAIVDLGFQISTEIRLRLAWIDTPELRGSELLEGRRVRDLVREKILGQHVVIRTMKDAKGKYGRYLGEIFINGLDLNRWLFESGNARLWGRNPWV